MSQNYRNYKTFLYIPEIVEYIQINVSLKSMMEERVVVIGVDFISKITNHTTLIVLESKLINFY